MKPNSNENSKTIVAFMFSSLKSRFDLRTNKNNLHLYFPAVEF